MDQGASPEPPTRVLVTSAIGNVGCEVVRAILALGKCTVRGAGPSIDAVREMHGHGIDAVGLDFEQPRTFASAAKDCAELFLVRPHHVLCMESTLLPFIDVAIGSGVQHIVFLSCPGAPTNVLIPHHAVEKHLAQQTTSYALLRAGFFAQNLGIAYRHDIAEEGRLFLPAGRGRVAFVDVRDIAELAALVLADPLAHRNAAYDCTGPEALSFEETARLLTDVIRRPVRYDAASIAAYVRHLHLLGLPLAEIAVQTVLHVGARSGQTDKIDPTLERLLGRRPRTLAAYVRENAELWAQPARQVEVTEAVAVRA